MPNKQQEQVETEMRERGRDRAEGQIENAMRRGAASETPAGIALTQRAIAPMVKGLTAFYDKAMAGQPGHRQASANLMHGVPLDLAAYLTVRIGINAAVKRDSLKGAAGTIARTLMQELIAGEFEEKEEALYRTIVRNARARGLNQQRVGSAVMMGNRKFEVVEKPWTPGECIQLGVKLIEVAVETLGIFTVEQIVVARHRTRYVLSLTDKIESWFKEFNLAASITRPYYLPMVVTPDKWTGAYGSPYYGPMKENRSIVLRPFRGQMALLEAENPTTVYESVNAIQETPWRINKRVLEVMQQVWERDAGLPCVPHREDREKPEVPQHVTDSPVGSDVRKAWRRTMRTYYEQVHRNRAHRFDFVRSMNIAQDFADCEAIYFPHKLDFRGRCYTVGTGLTPQGPDQARGLLEFSKGKPLGERGHYWLAVHGANLFGNDKVSFDERYQWAIDHLDHAQDVRRDPLANLWWTEADKPWSCLAWCFEWAEAGADNPWTYVSHLPIALDGSCNGLQHYSAMLRDPVGGAAVNLVPSDKPQDIYQRVADRTVELLSKERDPAVKWMADSWIQFKINRKITKRAVMVLPYGGTFKSCMDYVREAVKERIQDDGQENPFGEHLNKACAYLAKLVWAAIGDTVVAAREGMTWLQKVARVLGNEGRGLTWTAPSGFPVVQTYRDVQNIRVKTRFQGSIIDMRGVGEAETLDVAKQVAAIAPNFVHSLDAAAMMLTIERGKALGIEAWAMIHDSYGTHAADTQLLADTLREAFVDMYAKHDVLAEFAASNRTAQFEDVPPLPEQGSLDISLVRQSPYFFG